jgi:predicted RNA-binding protein YlxR (DUF448 family)
MATVQYKPKIDLWRIVDGRTGKVMKDPGTNKAVDQGGQLHEIQADRILEAYLKKKRALNDSRAKE